MLARLTPATIKNQARSAAGTRSVIGGRGDTAPEQPSIRVVGPIEDTLLLPPSKGKRLQNESVDLQQQLGIGIATLLNEEKGQTRISRSRLLTGFYVDPDCPAVRAHCGTMDDRRF